MLALIMNIVKPTPLPPAMLYPYEFPTSGFSRVDEVRFLIEDQSDWDFYYDAAESAAGCASAASHFGFSWPYSQEENALCSMLSKLHAGPHIITYAWGLYADLIKTGPGSD